MKAIIDLKKDYSEARALEDQEMIHAPKMKDALRIVNGLMEEAQVYDDQPRLPLPRVHNTISIFASRGAGKSSFLLSLMNRIKESHKEAICLPPIDPSHIESKQHPFVNVLAGIHEAIDKELETRYGDVGDAIGLEMRQNTIKQKNLVLKGLQTIEGIGHSNLYEEWTDDDFISMQGMEQALACNNLDVNFHEYVRHALRMVSKKSIVIAFDDIDIDFKKGFQILEIVRKYLTSPQIIVILTGDQQLYTTLVRKHQWQFFDDDYITKETQHAKSHAQTFAMMVNNLENQYIAKVLKPENRINLLTISEYLDGKEMEISVKYKDGRTTGLTDFYKDLLSRVGAQSASQDEMAHFITELSLRAQIRIMTLCRMTLETGTEDETRHRLVTGLMSIFSTDIYQKTDNAKELINGSAIYTIEMLRMLVHSKTLFTSCNFMPQTEDLILNKALLAVGVKFDDDMQSDNSLVFDFWARICYTKVLVERLGGKTDDEVTGKMIAFSQMDSNIGLSKSVGLSEAYFQGQTYKRGSMLMPGCIYIGNDVPSLLAEKNEFLPLMPMQGTVDGRNSVTVIVSVYRILAVLAEFVQQVNQNDGNFEWNAQVALVKLGQYRNYIEPSTGMPFIDDEMRPKELPWNYLDGNGDLQKVENMIRIAKGWAKHKVKASVQKLNRVFTRFYFTVMQLEDRHYSNLGAKLNDIILALMNAAIVEDGIESKTEGININHIGDITQIFVENWRVLQTNKNNDKIWPLSKWLFLCPILRLYVNPLVLNMLKDEAPDKAGVLSAVVQYGQWLTEQEDINVEIEELDKQGAEITRNLANMQIIERGHQLEETIKNYEFLVSEARDVRDFEQVKQLTAKIEEMHKELETYQQVAPFTMVRTEEGHYATAYTDIDELSEIKDVLQERNYHLVVRKQELNNRKKELGKKIEETASFVKEDYEKIKEKVNRYSIYPQYCTIKLSQRS